MAGAGPSLPPVHFAPAPWSTPPQHRDEVRTIFILGFPPDVKERELHNLLRWWPGFEASQMNFKGEQPTGFALFSSAAMAMAARDALQNLQFDPESNSLLRAEMAKKNLYLKRGPGFEAPFDQSKRPRTVGDSVPSFASPSVYPSNSWGPPSFVSPAPVYDFYTGQGIPSAPIMMPPVTPAGSSYSLNLKDNPPCNTLFVGNLSEHVNEAELQGVFSMQPGFRQMKILRHERNSVCFIEFVDVNSAIAAHTNLQGLVLASSHRAGMRLQYSKNPFGKKKEYMDATEGSAPGVSDSNGVPGGKPMQGA